MALTLVSGVPWHVWAGDERAIATALELLEEGKHGSANGGGGVQMSG